MRSKFIPLVLSAAILGSAVAPVYAEAPPETLVQLADSPQVQAEPQVGADARLAAVTEKVKAALGLDTTAYDEFHGDLDEAELAPSWQLEWNGRDGSVSVSATEDGKILRYRASDNEASPYYTNDRAPTFPKGDRQKARAAATAFVEKLLGPRETVTLKDRGGDELSATSYRFYGEVLIDGLSAGLDCSVNVRCQDNAVLYFYRESLEGSTIGEIPSAEAKLSATEAGKSLRGTLKLKLEYRLAEEEGTRAVLRYLPEVGDDYYVDAQSGELVDLDELYRAVDEDGGTVTNFKEEAAAEAPAADTASSGDGSSLTDAEQLGAAELEGVLSKEALDEKARAIEALGLNAYTLSTVKYAASREEKGKVVATLRYGRQVDSNAWRRTVTLDAKTGALESVYSSAWASEEGMARPVRAEAARKNAEAFLQAQCPGLFAKSELYTSEDALKGNYEISHSFQYVQKENGYFFPENQIWVSVDATDGSISSYQRDFNEAVTFDTPDGILTMDQALDAWLGTYEVALRYVQVPQAVDYSQPEYEPLAAFGVKYLHKLVLGYELTREDEVSAIDAKSGEAVRPVGFRGDGTLRYSDIAGHWAEAKLTELARYGVGFDGGTFQPNAALTQRAMLALLLSCDGYRFSPDKDEDDDALYQEAYQRGILTAGERNADAVLTRADAVRMLLDATGYGPVARLSGIFQTGFQDDGQIGASDYGYAALAQGLGVVTGQTFAASERPTRAQAAVMLYGLLSRGGA